MHRTLGCAMVLLVGGAVHAAPEPRAGSGRVSLANGVTVELLGVCTYPAGDQAWWRPDGPPLPKAPFETLRLQAPGEATNPARRGFQVAVRYSLTERGGAIRLVSGSIPTPGRRSRGGIVAQEEETATSVAWLWGVWLPEAAGAVQTWSSRPRSARWSPASKATWRKCGSGTSR